MSWDIKATLALVQYKLDTVHCTVCSVYNTISNELRIGGGRFAREIHLAVHMIIKTYFFINLVVCAQVVSVWRVRRGVLGKNKDDWTLIGIFLFFYFFILMVLY